MRVHPAVLIPGDGIGPEVAAAVCRILAAAQAPLEWHEHLAGIAALETHGEVLPESTVQRIAACGVALKGPCSTPVGKGFSSVNVQLRKQLNLFAAVRPVRSLTGVKTRYADVDLTIIRENTEGLYSGLENRVTDDVVMSLKVARQRGHRQLTVFHKANILKLSDGLFLECARRVHEAEFPDIQYEELIIDAGCMRIVQNPAQFDLLLLENLYGDVVSDLCAGLVGGLGVVPGANLGNSCAVFEAVHGSAPDIAGRGIANPMALLMSAVMMLNHLADTRGDASCRVAAQRIKQAYNAALEEGDTTADIGGSLSTEAFADAVIRRLPPAEPPST